MNKSIKLIIALWTAHLVLIPLLIHADKVENMRPDQILQLYQTMKDTHEIFTKYGIEYWAQGGTLLGAVRHHGHIAWDDDIDINIDVTQEQAFMDLKPIFNKNGYGIQNCYPEATWLYKIYPFKSTGVNLDVFLTVKKRKKIVYKYHWFKRDDKPIFVTYDELYPLKLYQFGEIQIYGPNNPVPYLDASFGKDWPDTAKKYNHKTKEKETIKLEENDKVPAEPTGPLTDMTDY